MNVRKIFSVLLVGLFIVSLCGCSIFTEKPTGYNGTVWGSSKAQVKKVENSENLLFDRDDSLIYTDFDLSNPLSQYGLTIAEAPLVEYRFTKGKLSEIVINIENNAVSYKSAQSVFKSLQAKYGYAELKQDWDSQGKMLISEWASFETEHSKITFFVMERGLLENDMTLTFKPLK